MDALNLGQAACVELRGSADGMEVHRAVFLQRSPRLRSHSTFTHHRAQSETANDVGLVGLFTNAGGWTGSLDAPLTIFLQHHRTAMIENCTPHVVGRVVVQI